MYPIVGRYGPFFLYSYTVVMGLGLAAGIGLSAWFIKKEKDEGPTPDTYHGWLDGLLAAFVAAMAGGRAGFVWANSGYFQERPEEILLVWQGGLSYHGALICGLLAFQLWGLWQRSRGGRLVSFTKYAALLMPGLVLAHLFGWAACWLEGCAFGRETTASWLAADLPDSFGVFAVRYQSQLLGFGLTAVLFVLALVLRRRLRAGPFLWLTFGLMSAVYGIVTLFRGDTVPMVSGYRLDTVVSAALIIFSLVGLVLQFRVKDGSQIEQDAKGRTR